MKTIQELRDAQFTAPKLNQETPTARPAPVTLQSLADSAMNQYLHICRSGGEVGIAIKPAEGSKPGQIRVFRAPESPPAGFEVPTPEIHGPRLTGFEFRAKAMAILLTAPVLPSQ